MEIKKHIEASRLNELGAMGDDFLNEVLDAVKTSGQKMISQYHQAVADNDVEGIKLHVHSLKGAILNVGLLGVSDQIQEINQLAKDDKIDEAKEKFAAFEADFVKLLNMIP